jgi:hypothetical protein
VLATAGIEGQVEWQGEPLASWSIPIPSLEERADLWTEALGGAVAMSATLAATHRSGSHRISSIAHLAQTNASLANANVPDETHVNAAARLGEGTGLDGLAQRVTDEIPDAALVTTPELHRELNHLLARCRARDGLADGLGLSASTRYHPGVKALFTGASGTGKTLAAGWLATRLGLPLYRVDLASVTSKYIGETEKNLGRLLGRAEHAGVILLFDEADSLFGRRTDVKDSNDRYANGQTNYLLQRLESADLIALLTSNSRSRIDSAFTRRLDMIVEFPLPGPEERRSLWQSHLGEHSHLSACELNQLSSVGELCGGHIRNIVLSAAVSARSAKRKIVYSDALQALSGELRKLGRSVPADLHKAS